MEIQGTITIQLTMQEFARLMNVVEDYVCEYAQAGDLIIKMYDKMGELTK